MGTYVNNNDGTVTDTGTGLIWQQADDGVNRNWEEALFYCESLELAGRNDWRLPNIRELQSILDDGRADGPAINPAFSCKYDWYHTSSTYAWREISWKDNYWGVDFLDGSTGGDGKSYRGSYVRCVSGGSAINDIDGDGINDENDSFPRDPNEWDDTDQDGIGNNADPDDDNDGMPDIWEQTYGLAPLFDDAESDKDEDGASNLKEYKFGTDPTNANSYPMMAMPWIPLLLIDK